MELTIAEQIKQCEMIIENDGCRGVKCNDCCINHDLEHVHGVAQSVYLAKKKLKELDSDMVFKENELNNITIFHDKGKTDVSCRTMINIVYGI